jgi:Tol biopolymer transport system component
MVNVGPVLRRLLTGLALAVALIGLGCGGSSSQTAPRTSTSGSASPSGAKTIPVGMLHGKILFTRAGREYGDETVFTADADGTRQRRITGFGKTCCPRWTPDGKHVLLGAEARDHRITTGIFSPDGSHLRTVPLPPGTLNLGCTQAFSLATRRLACEGLSEQRYELQGVYTIKLDGSDVVRVTHGSFVKDDRPFGFSPDGTQIFFFRAIKGFPSIGDQLEGSLYSVNVDGSHLRRITPRKMPVEVVGNAGGRLSADGHAIVFTSSGAIWTVRPDGSHLTKVFEDGHGRLAITPTWSPNGRFILFGLDPAGSLATVDVAPANGLYVIRANGTGLTPIVASNDWKREPDWVAAG